MSTDKPPLPEAVREQMEKTADALLWDSVPLCDETVQEILCEFALVCLGAVAQQAHTSAPADSLMRRAYAQDLTQLVQERDQWKARAEALEAAAQQERARREQLDAKLSVVVECFRAWCRTPDIGVDADTEHALHELRDAYDAAASHPPPTPEGKP